MASLEAVHTEIALLDVTLPNVCDVGEGGVRVVCTMCGHWDWEGYRDTWHSIDYEVFALQAYAQHVRDKHLEVS